MLNGVIDYPEKVYNTLQKTTNRVINNLNWKKHVNKMQCDYQE